MNDEVKPKKAATELHERTRDYALRVLKLYSALPKTIPAQVLGKQLLRSGTSVGAQYREAHRAKSNADFVNKIEGVLQELDETAFWLELIAADQILKPSRLQPLMAETTELIAIFVASAKRVKSKFKA